MSARCPRCRAVDPGHTVAECTPAPCGDCGGIEAHLSASCPQWQRMAHVEAPRG